MTVAFVVVCLAAAALVAASTSVVIGGALRLGRSALTRIEPRSRARLLLAAAVAPVVASVAAVFAAASPWLGGVGDHCVHHHHHPHLCARHAELDGAVLPQVLAAWLAFAAALAIGRAVWTAWVDARATRALRAGAAAIPEGVHVLDHPEPLACIAGLFRPAVFLSRALLARVSASTLNVVVAHERAHAERMDPLRRWCARIALAFHVPGLGAMIGSALDAAHEAAADRDAAEQVGDPSLVASAIVEVARLRLGAPPEGAYVSAFGGAELETRVIELLDDSRRRRLPGWVLALAGAGVLSAMLAGSSRIHHAIETVLGALGG